MTVCMNAYCGESFFPTESSDGKFCSWRCQEFVSSPPETYQPAPSRDRIDAPDRDAEHSEQSMQEAIEALQRLRTVVAEADRFLEDEEFGHA